MTILPLKAVETVSNYPYGFKLKTDATFSIEFDKKKGFRSVFQTIDPRNGRTNKPKKSTYSQLVCQYKDENGHIKTLGFNIYGFEDVNKVAKFVADNYDALELTDEMKEYLAMEMFTASKISARYIAQDKVSEGLQLLDKSIKATVKIIKEKTNEFKDIVIPVAEIEALGSVQWIIS